ARLHAPEEPAGDRRRQHADLLLRPRRADRHGDRRHRLRADADAAQGERARLRPARLERALLGDGSRRPLPTARRRLLPRRPGHSIVRLTPDGDPKKTIVDQRPLFDWVVMTAQDHTLQPGQHMTLRGEGREPSGMDTAIHYDRIDSPAITHRYDLLEADPQKPY